jgi:hypothetical protein
MPLLLQLPKGNLTGETQRKKPPVAGPPQEFGKDADTKPCLSVHK